MFHVRALYYTKTLITSKCTKRVLSSIVTHSYMFRPCWVIFRESFFVIVTPTLHFIVEWERAVDCVLEAWTLCGPGLQNSRLQKQGSTQPIALSHSTIKCNLSVTITKRLSLKMTQQGRNMLECVTIDDKTLFVHLLVISVFEYFWYYMH
jgi:hypothetical protein